jgi:hypothetical protein
MRLLNVQTLELKNFYDDQIPPYIILSHTWGDEKDEVTLKEMIERSATRKRGQPCLSLAMPLLKACS